MTAVREYFHMMTIEEVQNIIDSISYKDWTLDVLIEGGEFFIQWYFNYEGKKQWSRKWLVPPTMSKSEIVSTAFKAALTAEEHECREAFRYKNKKVFGPHFDVDLLAEIAGKKANLDIGTPFNR